jgi:HPt (histidine-containing phosphotransfer) domain-containing protein
MNTNILDTDKISSLTSLLGDDFLAIIKVFIASIPDSLKQVRAANESNNTEELRKLLHSMKGSSGNVGASAFSQKCQELELVIKSGASNLEAELISDLEQIFASTEIALNALD